MQQRLGFLGLGLLAAGVIGSACSSDSSSTDANTGGTAGDSGSCTPVTCASEGRSCGSLDDGCGATLSCGSCAAPASCNAGVCGCTPTTCAAEGKNCGTMPDGCSGVLECGTCGGSETCGGGDPGVANVCGDGACTALTTCEAEGKDCGTISDGCGSVLECGTCTAPDVCGGNGVANECACQPTTCGAEGKNCGSISDGCGGTLDCGVCSGGQACGFNNVCEVGGTGGAGGGGGSGGGTGGTGGSVGWPGTTINAATCSFSDVQSAVASASDGDTVAIPAGNCTWTNAISVQKSIRILGAGIGQTNLNGGRFNASAPDGKQWRVSGMTITGTGGFNVSSHSKSWRIDNIRFNAVSGFSQNRIIWIEPDDGGYTAGLVDHCIFDDPDSIQVHIREAWGGGNNSYQRPLDLGGADAIYVEDCEFNHSVLQVSNPVTDCEGGGRIVMRHSSIKNSYTEMHDAIIGGLRSCRKWETYANTFQTTYASGQCSYIGIRGGTGVAFDNTFLNAPDCDPISVALYRTYQTGGDPWDVLCSNNSGKACLDTSASYPEGCTSDAQCGGEPGSCVKVDGNSASPNGYPCRDQLGTDGNATQTSRPALFWNNKFASGSQSPPDVGGTSATYVQQGRDYCTGSSMPTSCNGVATTYTPYAYPHPLTAL